MSTSRDQSSHTSSDVPVSSSIVRCHVGFLREDDGTYSAIVLNLPGCGTCGDTIEDATHHLSDAVNATLDSYGNNPPWISNYELPTDMDIRWI